jgi:hypothetical protein
MPDYMVKKHKPLTKLNDNIIQNIKNIESEVQSKKKKEKERNE